MVTILNILILLITAILSTSFLPHFRIFLVIPLLSLFFIIQLTYHRPGFEPLLLAAAAGIYFDLFSPYPFGFYLILFLATAGLVRYLFQEGMRILSFWRYMSIAAIALACYLGAQLIQLKVIGLYFGNEAVVPVLAAILVNLLFAALMYPLGIWYFDKVVVLEDHLKRR
jgi:rod shape-determining protein MreD